MAQTNEPGRMTLADLAAKVAAPAIAVRDAARAISDSPGAAPLHASWRGGLKDLQDAVLPAFPDSAKAREEPGAIASPTPHLVTEQLTGGKMTSLDDLRSYAATRAAEASKQMEQPSQQQERGGRGM